MYIALTIAIMGAFIAFAYLAQWRLRVHGNTPFDKAALSLATRNPYRTGGNVYIMESATDPSCNWQGTVMGMDNGMVLVREIEAPYDVIHVHKHAVFGVNS